MSFIEKLDWRNATKSFDATKNVEPTHLNTILRSIRMAPTSFGLQPFYVRVVSDASTKEKLRVAGWNQVQFVTAPYVLVFVARSEVGGRISELVELLKREVPERAQTLPIYEKMMRDFAGKFDSAARVAWAQRQTYIALGFAMAACAELDLDSCPLEGFEPGMFDEILNVKPGDHATVALAIGHRDAKFVPGKKVRFDESDLIRI